MSASEERMRSIAARYSCSDIEAKCPKKRMLRVMRLREFARGPAKVGRTATMARSKEIRQAAASVSKAGRSCGSPDRLKEMVRTMEEMVIRMLAFVSAIRLSCTWCCCAVRSRLSTLDRGETLLKGARCSVGFAAIAVSVLRSLKICRVRPLHGLVVVLLSVSCSTAPARMASPEQLRALASPLQQITAGDALVIGAGDIARCGDQLANARATAAIVQQFPTATVITIGDNAYDRGRAEEFANCYDSTWGAFKSRTRPSPGNHEYYSNDNAAGYFAYFKVPEYYSFNLGNWHLVSLDSMIDMSASSDQVAWLRSDLAANSKPCILAYWHHPRFSSGIHGLQRNDPGRRTAVLWTVLAEHHATLILNGHDHDYERFTPLHGS